MCACNDNAPFFVQNSNVAHHRHHTTTTDNDDNNETYGQNSYIWYVSNSDYVGVIPLRQIVLYHLLWLIAQIYQNPVMTWALRT